MKPALIICAIFLAGTAMGQTSAITATLTDSDGQTWNNGSYVITFVPTPGIPGPFTWNGGQAFTQQFRGNLNAGGALTVSIPDSSFIAPAGSSWQFTLCPNASFQCSQVTIPVTGASVNLSSTLSAALIVPRFGTGPNSYGYLDVEVGTPAAPLQPGGTYFNVTSSVLRFWNGSIWQNFSGGSPVTLKTNGSTNATQSLLNLIQGTNVTLTADLSGGVTIAAAGGGSTPSAPGLSLQAANSGATALHGTLGTSYTAGTSIDRVDISNQSNTRIITPTYNWSQNPADDLSTPGVNTIHLNPCPPGIDPSATATKPYAVYISGGTGTAEAARVTSSSTCTVGSAGTIIVTTANAHTGSYTVGSASWGIQEGINDMGGPNAHVIIPPSKALTGWLTPQNANSYDIYATVYIQANTLTIDAAGASFYCHTRDWCFFAGDKGNTNAWSHFRWNGGRFSSSLTPVVASITNSVCASNVCTLTFSGSQVFVAGDTIDVQHTRFLSYWGPHIVTAVGSSPSTVTWACTGCVVSTAADTGSISINNTAIGSNVNDSKYEYLYMDNPGGVSGKFTHHITIIGDEPSEISHLSADSVMVADNTTGFTGSSVYIPGPYGGTSAGPSVVYVHDSTISPNCGGDGIFAQNGNTLAVKDTIVQGYSRFGILTGNARGGFGNTDTSNVYEEVGSCTNPYYIKAGAATAGAKAFAGIIAQGGNVVTRAGEYPNGLLPVVQCSASAGSNIFHYWVVPHDSVLGVGPPLNIGTTASTCSGTATVFFPQIPGSNTVTYDYIRTVDAGTSITQVVAPYTAGCTGGSVTACGSVATAQAQCSAEICSFTDNTAASTTSYTVGTPTWGVFLPYWPGSGISSTATNAAMSQPPAASVFYAETTTATTINPFVGVNGIVAPTIEATQCNGIGFIGIVVNCAGGPAPTNNNGKGLAFLLSNGPEGGGDSTANSMKGRVNLISQPGVSHYAQDLETYVDSNGAKTISDPTYRPAWDAADTAFCLDHSGGATGANVKACLRTPLQFDWYIGTVADGSSWLERLTSSAKTFKVPLTLSGTAFAMNSPEVSAPSAPAAGTQSLYASAGNGYCSKDSASNVYCMTSAGAATFYQTVQSSGVAVTQRPTLNMTGAGVSCVDNAGATRTDCTIPGAGTVTSFSAGNLSPLFTTSVANSTSTPALSFSLSNAAGGTVFGRSAGTSGAPSYTSTPVLGIAGTTIGTLGFAGNTSGTVTVTPQATAGSPTLTLPNTTGTLADGATTPLVLSATTGNLTCPTCVTSPGMTLQRLQKSVSTQGLTDSCLSDDGTTVTNNCTGGYTSVGTTIFKTNTASNTDVAGRITLSGGTGSYSFANTYATAPVCMFRDETTPANAVTTQTVTTTTISVAGTGTDVIAYICIGLN